MGRYILLVLLLTCGISNGQRDTVKLRLGTTPYVCFGLGKGVGVAYDVNKRIRFCFSMQHRDWVDWFVRLPHRPPDEPFMKLEKDSHTQLRSFLDIGYKVDRQSYMGIFQGIVRRESTNWFSEYWESSYQSYSTNEYSLPNSQFQYFAGLFVSLQRTYSTGFFIDFTCGGAYSLLHWKTSKNYPQRETHPRHYHYLDAFYHNHLLYRLLVRFEFRLGYTIRSKKEY